MSEYIIRYKLKKWGSPRRLDSWGYSTKITNDSTYSATNELDKIITKMTLEDAMKNIIKIEKIHRGTEYEVKKIQILNAETKEIIYNGPEPISRFELMDI